MNRRDFSIRVGVGLAAASVRGAAKAAKRPNIMFIMSDDHTSQAVGAYGSRLQQLNPTPTIDMLAKEGVLMENAFCTNAICTPSRACIMTGQYSAVNGVTDLGGRLPPERQYLSIEMRKAGYTTAVVGKWHLKERPSTFDYYKVLPGQGKYHNPSFFTGALNDTKGTEVQMTGHSSDCVRESVLEWFKNRDTTKPFFLKLHFKAPHDMFDNAERYESYLEDVEIPEPANMWEQGNHGSIATRGYKDELLPYIGTSIGDRNPRRNYAKLWADDLTDPVARKKKAYQVYMKKYLRCVKGVDDNLKLVFDYMKKEGLFDNTVIMYTGDQGFYLGEHDYMDKRWGYEEGMRMPFLVRYPKTIKAGSRSDAIVENVDYGPTMLAFAGVPTPSYMQGRSFKSIIETGKEPDDWKQAAYYRYWMHMAHHDNPAHIGMRTKRYKLLFFYGAAEKSGTPDTPPGWELYDLKNDPAEMNNVYDNPEYASVVAKLKGEMKALYVKYGEDDPKYACSKAVADFWADDAEDRKQAIEISHEVVKAVENGTWPHNRRIKKPTKKKKK
ncbi:MAG: sulfatase [Kiritimatiellales bacterium]|nr:sulfatase [Kiritimatiellales bacterium]